MYLHYDVVTVASHIIDFPKSKKPNKIYVNEKLRVYN